LPQLRQVAQHDSSLLAQLRAVIPQLTELCFDDLSFFGHVFETPPRRSIIVVQTSRAGALKRCTQSAIRELMFEVEIQREDRRHHDGNSQIALQGGFRRRLCVSQVFLERGDLHGVLLESRS